MKYIFCVIFFWSSGLLMAVEVDTVLSEMSDSSAFIVVKEMVISGNKRTKRNIILREVDVLPGGKILAQDTAKFLGITQNNIFNTGLFNSVDVHFTKVHDGEYIILITVVERWYIFPLPMVALVDRNFTEFSQRQDDGKKRVIYGLDFSDKNFRGRNEKLDILAVTGFYNKYEIFYTIPYIDKKERWGVQLFLSYSENKEVAYQSLDNKLNYLDANITLRERYYTGLSFKYRPEFYTTHYFETFFRFNRVNDTIIDLNPSYFLNGDVQQRYFHFVYRYLRNKTDVNYYPTKGYFLRGELEQIGGIVGDVSLTNIKWESSGFLPLSKKLFLASGLSLKLSSPQDQAYFNVMGLGYKQQYVRGYELYVVDGDSYVMQRTSFKWKFAQMKVDASRALKATQFNKIPYAFYLKIYADWGYAAANHSFENNFVNDQLSNRMTYGYGIGLDVVTFYDMVIRFEYSFNGLGERGFFLNWGKAI